MSVWSWAFFLLIAIGVPIQSLRGVRQATGLPRVTLYLNISLTLWILAGLGWAVVALDGESLADVGLARGGIGGAAQWLGWTLGLTGACLLLFVVSMLAERLDLLPRRSEMLARLRPRTRAEWLIVCLLVAPTAGICEEVLYRGVILSRLTGLTGSPMVAVLLVSVMFGLTHLYQGWAGGARAALIGAVLAWPVVSLGSLFPSIAAHALVDILAILIWHLAETPEPDTAPA